jgi:hypothetical protein
MMGKVHLVTYSNNRPFRDTQQKLNETIDNFTSCEVVKHSYTMDIISKLDWFQNVNELLKYNIFFSRDGYFNAWKPFIIKDVIDRAEDGDIIYYVDSSKYYISGFEFNLDKLFEITNDLEFISGSFANDVRNNSFNCCNIIEVWKNIIPNVNDNVLNYPHILNSWFVLKKNDFTTNFIDEWIKYSFETIDNEPLIIKHHTVDQSIFNILCHKHNTYCFFEKTLLHNYNKDRNTVLSFINNDNECKKYFIKISDWREL